MLEKATYRFVESTNAQLTALFEAWRQDIDSEPFAYEGEWATVDAPAFHVVSSWAPHRHGPQPRACPGGTPGVP
jgi:hypothetical protein